MPRRKQAPKRKRASPGSGSVYVIKTGPRAGGWRGAAVVTLLTGERKRIYVVARSETEARTQLERRRVQLEKGTAAGADLDPRMALREFLAAWLDTVVRLETRPSTYESYTRLCRRLADQIGNMALEDVSKPDVQRAYAALMGVLAPSTLRVLHAVFHRAMERAIEWELIRLNPARTPTLPRVSRPEIHTLTDVQLALLLSTAERERGPLSAYWIVLATTGMRRAEARGLRWRDVDLAAGSLLVRGQVTRTADGYLYQEPKTKQGRRTITLMDITLRALRRHRQDEPGTETEYAFRQASGQPWGDGSIQWHWRALLRRAGLPTIRLHDLRHTVATLMMARGQPAPVVSEMLGHADVRITLGTYSHVMPRMHTTAIRDLESVLGAHMSVDAVHDAEPKRQNRAS